MKEIEKHVTEEDKITPDFSKDISQIGYIADVMASTHKIRSKDFKSFCDFTRTILNFIFKSAKDAQRIDLIFDSYTEKIEITLNFYF